MKLALAAVMVCALGYTAVGVNAGTSAADPRPCELLGTCTTPPPPPPPGTPIAQGHYTKPGWMGVFFRTPSGTSCMIEHQPWWADDDARCNFVPNDGSGAQAGWNQTYVGTSTPGQYQSVNNPPDASGFDVLPVGQQLVNGRANCTVVDQATVSCTAGAHGFAISPANGQLW